jgi:multidrug efflux system membrane fusion protein
MPTPPETTRQRSVPPTHAVPGGTPAESELEMPEQASHLKQIVIFAGCVVVLAILVLILRYAKSGAEKRGPGAGRGTNPPVAVVAGIVAKKDMPIYLEGVGTVQAYNTVTVRARVDGEVEKIAFTEGQDVRAGDLLAQIDPAPFRASLEQAEAKKGQDEAQLANARVDLKRYGELLANEGVTQQQYDTQKALVDQLVATVKADQAAIESAKVQLGYTSITSPIDGRAGIRLVDQGNIVHAGDAGGIVVLTQLRPISVVFTLPAQTLNRIRRETHGTNMTVFAVDQDATNILAQGELAVIDNQIDVATGTIKLKATFPNTDLHLWPGQFVNTRLLLNVRQDCAVVPASVIQRGPEGAFAFVIKDDHTVEVRPVTVALIEQGEAIIDEGLRPGDHIVVDGQYKLQKGSAVRINDGSAAPKAGGAAPDAGRKGKPGKKPEAAPAGAQAS